MSEQANSRRERRSERLEQINRNRRSIPAWKGLLAQALRLVQNGICPWCGDAIYPEDRIEVAFAEPLIEGGEWCIDNLQAIHAYCAHGAGGKHATDTTHRNSTKHWKHGVLNG